MEKRNKILIDAFGGDNAPEEIVKGAVAALQKESGFTIGLTGKSEEIEKILSLIQLDTEHAAILTTRGESGGRD